MAMLAELLTALVVGGFVTFGAVVTDTQEEVCAYIGGTYVPGNAAKGKDVCPDGRWSSLVGVTPH